MEYTHKFSSGPIRMEKMLEDYHNPRKLKTNFGNSGATAKIDFDETIFLKEFQYIYIVGREFWIPKDIRQKTIGIKSCCDYYIDTYNQMRLETWQDLLNLEKRLSGVMTLIPEICEFEKTNINANKLNTDDGKALRFSMEDLNFEVDACAQFEMGLLRKWSREGHLPEKISNVMAILTNEKIPMDVIKSFFPEGKRSYLRAGETSLGGEFKPKAKRLDSWLDKQQEEIFEYESNQNIEHRSSWIGFKSESLDSGSYVLDRPWAEGDDEYPDPPMEVVEPEAEEIQLMEPEPEPEPLETAETQNLEDEDSQYQWIGFKRSADEAAEKMYNRPIPKFNVSEEEEEKPEVVEDEESLEEVPIKIPSKETTPFVDEQEAIRTELERKIKEQMAGMTETEQKVFLATQLGLDLSAISDESPKVQQVEVEQVQQDTAPTTKEVEVVTELEAVEENEEVEPESESVEFLSASTVGNVLSAALSIARDINNEESKTPIQIKEDVVPITPQEKKNDIEVEPELEKSVESGQLEEEDDSKYKWLGFKAVLTEDDGNSTKGWTKNY